MKESWKEVNEYPNYEVSDLGRVRNKKTGKLLSLKNVDRGYIRVGLCLNGKKKNYKMFVHVYT